MAGLEACLAGLEACLAGLEACLAGLEACLAGLETCLAGLEVCGLSPGPWLEHMDGRMDVQKSLITGFCPLSGPLLKISSYYMALPSIRAAAQERTKSLSPGAY